jgi:hypothetical protein
MSDFVVGRPVEPVAGPAAVGFAGPAAEARPVEEVEAGVEHKAVARPAVRVGFAL